MINHFHILRILTIILLAGVVAETWLAQAGQAAPAPCADLVITNFSVSPAQPTAGQTAELSITVRNQGSCQSLSAVLQWKSGQFAPNGPTQFIPQLNPNQSQVFTFEYAFPDPGNYTTVATADSDNTVDETNESNNVAILDVTVLPDLPDLAITNFMIVPENPTQGENAEIKIQVTNQGSKDAGPFIVQWKSDRSALTGPSTEVESLAADSSVDLTFVYAFPRAGDFTTVVNVDTDRTVTEIDEDNNLEIKDVLVGDAAPDLVVTDFRIIPAEPTPDVLTELGYPVLPVEGLNARIEIDVLNQGNAAADSFTVQWKSDRNAQTGPSTQVAGLEVDEATTVVFEYAFPRAGNFTTVVNLDTDRDVAELNESNNLEILNITVQEAVIDLDVVIFEVEPAAGIDVSIPPLPVQGRLSWIRIRFRNIGNAPAGDFVVKWTPRPLAAPLSAQVNGLAPGEFRSVVFDYTYAFAGEFLSIAELDSTKRVPESDEENNIATLDVTVEPQLPDLDIIQFEFKPADPVQGTQARLVTRVRNRGNTAAESFLVRFKPAPLAPAQSVQVNGLDVGEIKKLTFDHTYLFPGEFAASVTVDSTSRVRELDEDNNTWEHTVTVLQATRDLIVSGFEIKPLSDQGCSPDESFPVDPVEPVVLQGERILVCITVQNLGNSALGPFVVEWNPDAFGLITPSPGTLSSQVDLLDAGQETTVAFEFTYPDAGEFRSIANVDAFNTIRETNESNNLDILNVVVDASGPDLVVTQLGLSHQPYGEDPARCQNANVEVDLEEDRKVYVCMLVENQGNRDAGPFVLEWNADALGLITQGSQTLSEQVDELAAGESTVVILEYTYTQPGNFRTIAKVDAFNNVRELQEGNNLNVVNAKVEAMGPDLVISDFDIYPELNECPAQNGATEPQLQQGKLVLVCIEVTNEGNQPADTFLIEWNPDTFGLITPSPSTLSDQVDGLGVGESAVVAFNFTYHQYGEFRTTARVDAFNNVDELNEANNLAIINVLVDPGDIDLRITGFTIDPVEPVRASKATASITVKNFGEYPTGSFWVQWKPTGENARGGPTVRVDGLGPNGQPNDTVTVELESAFYVKGDYTSFAEVDIFDQIIETNENNNTATREVTVKQRETTLEIDFTNVKVFQAFEDGIGCAPLIPGECAGEYVMVFAVIDSDAQDACAVSIDVGDTFGVPTINVDEDGLRCRRITKGGLKDNDDFDPGVAIELTLVESEPLILGVLALQDAASPIDTPDFAGYILDFHSARDYPTLGEVTVGSQEVDIDGIDTDCPDSRDDQCYQVTYEVNLLDAPPPLFRRTAITTTDTLSEPITLPDGFAKLFGSNVNLPEGVQMPEDVPSVWEIDWEQAVATAPDNGHQLYIPLVIK